MRMRRLERQREFAREPEFSWMDRWRWLATVARRRGGWLLGLGLGGSVVLVICCVIGFGSYRQAETRLMLAERGEGSDQDWVTLRSAAGLVGSPRLIERALGRPEATAWRLRWRGMAGVNRAVGQIDPVCEPTQRSLRIRVRGATHAEAAGLADALAGALIEEQGLWRDASARRGVVEGERDRLQREREALRARLRAQGKETPEEYLEAKTVASVSEYRACLERLAQLRLARWEQAHRTTTGRAGGALQVAAHGDVSQDRAELARMRGQLAEAQRRSRTGSDVAVLQARIQELSARVASAGVGVGEEPVQAVYEARAEASEGFEREMAELEGRMEELERAARGAGGVSVERAFLREDLASVEAQLGRIQQRLADEIGLDGAGGGTFEIIQRARATVGSEHWPGLWRGLGGALCWLAACAWVCVAVERRVGRVSAPSEVVERLRLDVLSVIPPPPTGSGLYGLEEPERLEHFVRSVDHLRELICASWPDGPRRHVLLITSAVGSEGKTSLAAQLASRCAGAGLAIALVDADLRRPKLARLFDLNEEQPGLMDVLCGTAEAEEALHPVVQAGGFYVMPAGTEGMDPTRLLHSERLGQVMDQMRDAFDLVIVDAPPILPVADALTLGRWVDGAIVAVRRDTSRLSWVRDALGRLEAVDVPVLGAVVQGCEVEGHSYGPYRAAAV